MNKLYKNKYRTDSFRLKSWDYSNPWWYYVTICTKDKKCWFGKIKNGKMYLNNLGKIVNEEWLNTSNVRENIELDYFIIMPNHLHGIIIINSVETTRCVVSANDKIEQQIKKETSQRLVSTTIKSNSLGSIIGQIKSRVTKRIRSSGFPNFSWQPRFYDHIIRNDNDLYRIRKYISNNPLKWENDEYYK